MVLIDPHDQVIDTLQGMDLNLDNVLQVLSVDAQREKDLHFDDYEEK